MTAFATASFDGTAGTFLEDLGQNFVRHANASPSGAYIKTNGTHAHASNNWGNAVYRCTVEPPAADYAVSAPIVKRTVSDSSAGVIARLHATDATFYLAHHDENTGWRLLKCIAGSFTVLGTPYAQTLTLNSEYVVTLEVIGTAIKLYVDGTLRVSVTDSSITAAGYSGVQINGASANATTDYQIASFTADDLAAGTSLALTAAEGADTATVVWDVPTLMSLTATEGADTATVAWNIPDIFEDLFAGYFAAQWSMPSAVVRKGALYIGWTNELGDTGITKHVHGVGTTSFTLKTGPGTPNGHDSCVIGFLPDERVLCMWANHNEQMYYRISTNPLDVTAFGAQQILSTSAIVSYSNLHYLSVPGKHYLHYRTGSGGGPGDRPCRVRATADGVTWDTERVWISEPGERAYVRSRSDGHNRIDFVCTSKHVTDEGPAAFGIYYCRLIVDAAGTETFYDAAGTVIGTSNIQPTTDMTFLYDGSVVQGWPWDVTVGRDGHPRILWARHVSDYENYHMHSRWDGSAWVTTQIGEPQSRLYYTESWSDGALCFDAYNPDVIYRSVQGPLLTGGAEWSASGWDMQVWTTSDHGKTWAKALDLSDNSAAGFKNCRPVSPIGHDGRDAVIWSAGTIGNWDSFDLDCRAAPGARVEISLTDRAGGSVANTAGLEFVVLDAAVPGRSGNILASGATGFIDATGLAHLPAPGAAGSAVFAVLSDTDGNPTTDTNAFAGPVTVL